MRKQKKVLALVDYIARTGFSTVSTNIFKELKKHYGNDLQLDIIAINYFGEPYYEDENTYVISARRNDFKDDPFGRYFFLKMLNDSNDYDGIFICQDLGVIVSVIELLEAIKADKRKENKKSFKSIFYFPVDCALVPALTKGLEFFDVLVTYTEYGRREVLKLRPDLKGTLKVLPHGNNSKDFYPLSEDEIIKFRKEYFGDNANKFIITNISRNQPRKDIQRTIFGFIEAKSMLDDIVCEGTKPELFLYLHMHSTDPLGWQLPDIFLQTDLKEGVDYKLLPTEHELMMVDTSVMNLIYNASDVIISTTLGEGWGLLASEAASCQRPVILPYSTSFIEMSNYGKNAYMLETLYPYCGINDNVIRYQTDIFEVAETILKVAKIKNGFSPELEEEMYNKIKNNYEWVKKLEWSNVCKTWIEYFKIY